MVLLRECNEWAGLGRLSLSRPHTGTYASAKKVVCVTCVRTHRTHRMQKEDFDYHVKAYRCTIVRDATEDDLASLTRAVLSLRPDPRQHWADVLGGTPHCYSFHEVPENFNSPITKENFVNTLLRKKFLSYGTYRCYSVSFLSRCYC